MIEDVAQDAFSGITKIENKALSLIKDLNDQGIPVPESLIRLTQFKISKNKQLGLTDGLKLSSPPSRFDSLEKAADSISKLSEQLQEDFNIKGLNGGENIRTRKIPGDDRSLQEFVPIDKIDKIFDREFNDKNNLNPEKEDI